MKTTNEEQEDWYDQPDSSLESEDDLTDVSPESLSNAVVWGTDWTAGTIVDQLRRKTISLDPAFQRRDAWTDDRKSKFIESLVLGLPIPQLVLAEDQKTKGRFLVIDGKQRLLSLSKFTGVGLSKEQKPLVLSKLLIRTDLNNVTYQMMKDKVQYESLLSEFENQPIRTVVIRGWKTEEVLYTIFHRLNTGSVPLSTQELRQALHPGPFLGFAANFSEQSTTLQGLLGLSKPDFRMRDVELVVRHFAFEMRLTEYKGNLKKFLDDTCDLLNGQWLTEESSLRQKAAELELAIQAATKIFSRTEVFRKWDGARFEKPLNRAIFDAVVCSLTDPKVRLAAVQNKVAVRDAFKNLCLNDKFRASIESTTKSKVAVTTRFFLWYKAISAATGTRARIDLPHS